MNKKLAVKVTQNLSLMNAKMIINSRKLRNRTQQLSFIRFLHQHQHLTLRRPQGHFIDIRIEFENMFGLFGSKKPSKKSDFEIEEDDEEQGK